jgi:hypothetical protein
MSIQHPDSSHDTGWRTLVMVWMATVAGGSVLGAVTNASDGQVSRDYFAIVMSWDWQAAPWRAVAQGAIEGAALGLFFGAGLAIVIAASTRMRCPLWLALRALALGMSIALMAWIVGGIAGTVLARVDPRLWGFVFVGVPPRVDLPRFAWVGGSIWGAYGGTAAGLVAAAVYLHVRWRRTAAPAFAVLLADRSG